jgi:hypothetical protein
MAEDALEALQQELGDDVFIYLANHHEDDFTNPGVEGRYTFYDTMYVPASCFDGKNPMYHGSLSKYQYNSYINIRRAIASPLEITATQSTEGSTMHFEADVTNTSGSTVSDVSINFEAYEDLGTSHRRYMVRLVCPYQTITLAPGETQHLSAVGDIDEGIEPENMHGVVFAQLRNSTTKEVLQAARALPAYSPPPGLFGLGWNWFSLPVVPIDPNPDVIFGRSMANLIYMWHRVRKTVLLYPDDFTTLEMGEGYTLYLHHEVYEPSYAGTQAPPIGYIYLPLPGWSWIGYPHLGDTPLADCSVTNLDLAQTRTAPEDFSSPVPWVNWNWLYFDTQARTIKICTLAGGDDDTLHSWYGYRLWSNTENLQIEIPEG